MLGDEVIPTTSLLDDLWKARVEPRQAGMSAARVRPPPA